MNNKRIGNQWLWCIAFVLPSVVSMTGCVATVPEGSSAVAQEALKFNPQEKAGVYVVRPGPGGWAILMEVNLDFRGFGSLANDTYLFTTVEAGKHGITLPAWDAQTVRFTAEAGKNYFFTIDLGALGGVPRLRQIPEGEGQAFVRKFKLSGHNRFEHQNK